MKSILIQQSSEKFIQNCSSVSLDGITTIDIAVGNNLYQTFFRHKPEHCVFSGSSVNQEILQFCEDYGNQTNIYFFHMTSKSCEDLKTILSQKSKVSHIGYENCDIIIPSLLVNDQVFFNTNSNTKDGIVCFMDAFDSIPNDMLDVLYPNSSIPIKLFNCPSIKHYQNLGMLTEHNRAFVLQTHKYYLDLNQHIGLSYTNEAMACGAKVISLDSIKNNSYQETVMNNTNIKYITYNNFLRELLKL